MSFEPTVRCRECDDHLDVYMAYEERFCECCQENRNTMSPLGQSLFNLAVDMSRVVGEKR